MADIIEMIQLSPTMEEGLLVEWLKNEGDTIEVGDLIAEVETDKASMEMESFYDGTLLKILVEAGASVRVGLPLAIIGEPGEDISELIAKLSEGGGAPPKAAEEKPEEASKAAAPQSAPAASEAPTPAPPSPAVEDTSSPSLQPSDGNRVLASPLARRVASEHDLSLRDIAGSGPAGRVVKRDVEEALESGTSAKAATPAARAAQTAAPAESVALSPMRRAIARNTTEAWKIPAFMLTRSIRMDAALDFRKQLNQSLADREGGGKVSVNDVIVKAAALALRDVPAVNVAFEGEAIRQYAVSRIGIAVALDGGLITPVIEDAEGKGLRIIASEVADLATRARNKKLAPDEYSDASFSISNLGMLGVDHFTAVLNPPGAAILAVGRSKATLVPAENERGFETQTLMDVTLTCDHRALDGAVGAEWLQRFASYLESPLTMAL